MTRYLDLGPTLPEFLAPELVERLDAEFGLRPIDEPTADLRRMLDSSTATPAD